MSHRIASKWIGVFVAVVVLGCGVAARGDDLATVRKQFRDFHLRPDAADATLIDTLNADGSWPDIDYKNADRSGWLPARHASRIASLTATWCLAATNDPERARCAAAIHRAFGFWRTNDFQCPNWWYNRIGIPKTLGTAGVLLGDELKPAERAYLTSKVLARAGLDMTGQNRVWLAGITLMRAMLFDDARLARKAGNVIWSELTVGVREGVQPDFSFHQHGAQQQFGNYGLAFASDMTQWMTILRGTAYAPGADKTAILRGYLNDGLAWTIWHGKMDANCIGRQFDVDSLASHGQSAISAIAKFDAFDGVTNRVEPTGHRVFWRSDFVVHRRPEFMATLKMSSSRVIGAESLNSENLSGYHAADGVLLVSRTGEEYENIFPLWDWRRLPGVTAIRSDAPVPSFDHAQLTNDFVGAVGNGTNGIAALDYDRGGVHARKAWFFVGDQIICLGAGIASTNVEPVATSVNQCWKRGEIGNDGDGIVHDGIRYLPLGETKFQVASGPVTGSWLKVRNTATTPKSPVTGEVLSVTIDHGIRPQESSYAYAIMAGADQALRWHVAQNSPALQAIADDHSNLLVAFHEPGSIRVEGHSLTADQACLVMVNYSELPHVVAADPTRKLGRIDLSWDGQFRRLPIPGKSADGNAVAKDW